MPSARVRSRPSGKLVTISARTAGEGEQGDAGQEDPPPAEDVAGPAPEQQQAA
jgi:hypothetical protein